MKLIHLSDLHICSEPIRDDIIQLAEVASRELGVRVEISIATDDALEWLVRAVTELDPDVVCISGDITTFGDEASFDDALRFLRRIGERPGVPRKIIVTPGNHDVLCGQLMEALKLRNRLITMARSIKLRKTTALLRRLLQRVGVARGTDSFANYRRFCDDSRISGGATQVGDVQGKPVWIVPFNSVSSNPLWLNIGQVDRYEFNQFYASLRSVPKDSVLIALVHHNPISAPDVVDNPLLYAYNTMPGASLMIREMQTAGTDLVLYGHQHRQASCSLDYAATAGNQINLLGAAAAASGDAAGFNFIELLDRFRLQYSQVTFTPTGAYRKVPAQGLMIFDTDRPDDQLTLCTRGEIRYFRYLDVEGQEAQWNRMHEPGAADLLIVGPRLKRIMKERREQLREFLEHPNAMSLRILLSDPRLYQRIEKLSEDDTGHLKRIWGEDLSWEDQSRDAELTLKALREFSGELKEELRTKLQVKLAHTLLPIGAIARDIGGPQGSMLVRLLPVGLMGGVVKKPVVTLARRHPAAVHAFYQSYVEELWRSGRPYLVDGGESAAPAA